MAGRYGGEKKGRERDDEEAHKREGGSHSSDSGVTRDMLEMLKTKNDNTCSAMRGMDAQVSKELRTVESGLRRR